MEHACPKSLTVSELKEYQRRSTAPWVAAAVVEWAAIAGLFAVALAWPHWWVWIPAAFLIGTRQHALAVLVHEGSHFNVSRSRRWNDRLTNLVSAYPILITSQGYRSTHLDHHRLLERPDDPSRVSLDLHPKDWTFPMSRRRMAWILLRDLTGLSQSSSITLLKYLWKIPGGIARHVAGIAVWQAALLGAAFLAGNPWAYPLLWLAPVFTVLPLCYRVRSVAEHSGIGPQSLRYKRAKNEPMVTTRTTIPNRVMGLLFLPHGVSYHLEHHLYPSIPFFRLRRLHEELMTDPAYAAGARVTHGHRQLLHELTA